MVDYVITWGDINGVGSVSVVFKPKNCGLLVYETITGKGKWVRTPFFGTDTDGTTNVWSYYMDKKTWIIDEANKDGATTRVLSMPPNTVPLVLRYKTLRMPTALIFQAKLPCPTQRLKEQPLLQRHIRTPVGAT